MTERLTIPVEVPQILVVDDTLANLRLLTDLLEGEGYRVRPAASGRLALQSAALEAPDLVLLDVKMPDMDGYEVCRRLKADPGCRGIPVIFISAVDEAADKVRGFQEGGVDYIAKPFQAREVLARVDTHLTMRRLHKRLEEQNALLHREISDRQRAEEDLRKLNEVLEDRVEERTRQLQESQALLQAIIDNSTAVIYVKDLAGGYLLTNRRHEELFHLSRLEIIGRSDYDLFPAERADALRAFDRQVIERQTVLEAEEVVPHDDGLLHTYLSIKAPLLDESGTPYAICGISADITERKGAEREILRLNEALGQKIDQLLETREELVRKEKLAILGQLSGSVGHELRNPLGVMNNAVYFLKMVHSDGDKTTREYLDIIQHEIDTSLRIITDLLDFARTRAPRIRTLSIRALTEKSLVRCTIPDGITLLSEIPDHLPLFRGDPLQMEQVLHNLITNGIQAMPAGGVLRIGARAFGERPCDGPQAEKGEHPPRDFFEISVADSGVGIASENMKKLFQPLFTTKAKGIGLGLALCKNLVEANGGRISVESRVGEGTTFTVTLPQEGESAGEKELNVHEHL